nr:unnamed protein product [uncultured bacterium]
MTKPVIKWAGGKTQLLQEIKKRMPTYFNTYYEPFFGGGALFFDINPKKAVINDFNQELINLYKEIKNNPLDLIEELKQHQINHTEEYYNVVRSDFNIRINDPGSLSIKDAGELVYLNKMGFNGLYRVNLNGFYNVPSGHKKRCVLFQEQNIYEASEALKKAKIICGDFELSCKKAKKGDFVFFDSPYYDTFDTYQRGGFTTEDHKRLAKLFKKLSKKGVYCLLTNSNTDFIKELYQDFNIDVVKVKRMINCDGKNRTGEEVIITNYRGDELC